MDSPAHLSDSSPPYGDKPKPKPTVAVAVENNEGPKAPLPTPISPVGTRRRKRELRSAASKAGKVFNDAVEEVVAPGDVLSSDDLDGEDGVHLPESGVWLDGPLALTLLPPLGMYLTGGDFLRDGMVLALLFYYLRALIKTPWELYLKARARRPPVDGLYELYGLHEPDEDGEDDEEEDVNGIKTIQKLARSELRLAELIYLGLCLMTPFLGTLILKHVSTLLSSDSSLSWFSQGLFVLATGVRPWRHLVSLLLNRTDSLHDVVHAPSAAFTVGRGSRAEQKERTPRALAARLSALEETLKRIESGRSASSSSMASVLERLSTTVEQLEERFVSTTRVSDERVDEVSRSLRGIVGEVDQLHRRVTTAAASAAAASASANAALRGGVGAGAAGVVGGNGKVNEITGGLNLAWVPPGGMLSPASAYAGATPGPQARPSLHVGGATPSGFPSRRDLSPTYRNGGRRGMTPGTGARRTLGLSGPNTPLPPHENLSSGGGGTAVSDLIYSIVLFVVHAINTFIPSQAYQLPAPSYPIKLDLGTITHEGVHLGSRAVLLPVKLSQMLLHKVLGVLGGQASHPQQGSPRFTQGARALSPNAARDRDRDRDRALSPRAREKQPAFQGGPQEMGGIQHGLGLAVSSTSGSSSATSVAEGNVNAGQTPRQRVVTLMPGTSRK